MKRRKYPSLRLKGYDYSREGAYFITICTRNQALFFDNAEAESIVESIWSNLPERFPTIEVDEFVAMPNHLHFIIWLDPENVGAQIDCALTQDGKMESSIEGKAKEVDPFHPTIGQIIRSFKSQITRKVRTSGLSKFAWQRGYYDHIIRSEESLNRIREYIRSNPMRWHLDRYNPVSEGVDEEAIEIWEHLKSEDVRINQSN